MSHSASRVAGTNRTQVPIVPAVPPLLPSLSKTALLSLLPSVLISSRTHRRRAEASGQPQAAMDYGSIDRILLRQPSHDQPPSRFLGALPPEAPRRVSTPVALPEMPSSAEIEFIESVERYSHTDWAREQRAEPVCDAVVRYLLLSSPSVLPDNFLLHQAPRKLPPVVRSALFSR